MNRKAKETISSIGQVPIDACFYCRLKAGNSAARATVILLDRDLKDLGTFTVEDPAILKCLLEVVCRNGRYVRAAL